MHIFVPSFTATVVGGRLIGRLGGKMIVRLGGKMIVGLMIGGVLRQRETERTEREQMLLMRQLIGGKLIVRLMVGGMLLVRQLIGGKLIMRPGGKLIPLASVRSRRNMMDGCGGALTTLTARKGCVQLSIGAITNVACIIALHFS